MNDHKLNTPVDPLLMSKLQKSFSGHFLGITGALLTTALWESVNSSIHFTDT